MNKTEITDWALANGWQMIAGAPSLTKPSRPKEAIIRLVLKATVVHLEVKKPAGQWQKFAGLAYSKIEADSESGMPLGLGFESMPGFSMLMRENKDRQVFSNMG